MNQLVSTEVSVVQRNARAWLGLVEHDDDPLVNQDGYAAEDVSEIRGDDETPSDQFAMGNGIQIAIVRPRNFQDAATVGEYYRQDIPVIINLEDMETAEATRILDFASGLMLGLRGDIERLSRRAFLIVPAGAAILTDRDGLAEEGFFNQALRPLQAAVERVAKLAHRLVEQRGEVSRGVIQPVLVGRDRYPEHGVRYPGPYVDYAAIAMANGAYGVKVTAPGDLPDAIRAALSFDGPALVDVNVNPDEPPMPGKIEYEQAKKFAEAFLKGQPHKATIATTLFRDKIEQLRS